MATKKPVYTLPYTILSDVFVSTPASLTLHEQPFAALAKRIADPREYPNKAAMPLVKMGVFGNEPRVTTRADGKTTTCYRCDENIVALSGLEGDYDGEAVTLEDAADRLRKAGVQAILYTSPSHTPEKPRWRVLCPVSRVYEGSPGELAARRSELMRRLQGALGADCALSNESWTASQTYYIGKVKAVEYETRQVKGKPIDLIDGLPTLGNVAPRKTKTSSPGASEGVNLRACFESVVDGAEFHTALRDAAASLAGQGQSEESIGALLMAAHASSAAANPQHPRHDRWKKLPLEIHKLAQSAVGKYGKAQNKALLEGPVEAVEVPDGDFWNAADMAKLPPPQWLVRDLIHREGLCEIYGEPGSGKSALAFAIAMALGGGADSVLGDLRVLRHGGAIYYALEGNLRTRTQPYFIEGKVTGRPKVRFERAIALGTEEKDVEQWNELHDLIAVAKAGDPDFALLVVDTLARASSVDENTADLGKIADTLHRLARKFDIAVVLVHHSGKDATKGGRGHSSLKGAIDTEIEVLVEKDLNGKVTKRTLRVSKQREGEEGLAREFVLGVVDLGADPDAPQERVTGVLCQVKAGAAVPAKSGKAKVSGPTRGVQKKVYQTLMWMLSTVSRHPDARTTARGLGVPVEALLDEVKAKLPVEGERDRRRETARKSLGTIDSEHIWLVEEGGVQYAVLPVPVL